MTTEERASPASAGSTRASSATASILQTIHAIESGGAAVGLVEAAPGSNVTIGGQHPYGQPKQISFQNNLVEYADETVLQYVTSTDPGASGAPVLNDKWEVVGVHHAGGRLQEPQTQRYYNRNEGICISRILADLPAEIRGRIDRE